MHRYLVVLLAVLGTACGRGSTPTALSTAFDALAIPAGAASVDSLYRIASLTKPITASALRVSERALLINHFGFGALDSFDRSAGVTSFGMGASAPGGDLRFTHSGGLDSYSSFNVIFPGDRASVVILCNFPGNGVLNFVLGVGGLRSIMLANSLS